MNVTEDLRKTVALSLIPNMGPVSYKNLVSRFGGVSGALAVSQKEFARKKKGIRVSWEDLKAPDLLARADREI